MLKAMVIIPDELYQRGAFIHCSIDNKIKFFRQYNIDTVVNLWHKIDTGVIKYLWKYDHKYFPDSTITIDEKWLLDYAREIACWIDAGHVVLIHCYGGNNRSGLLSALVYRELYDVTGLEAAEHIKSLKSRALHNKLYYDFLAALPRLGVL